MRVLADAATRVELCASLHDFTPLHAEIVPLQLGSLESGLRLRDVQSPDGSQRQCRGCRDSRRSHFAPP
jgi:hypothetical protein